MAKSDINSIEYQEIEKTFKNDVCRQCKTCDHKDVQFCSHFFIMHPKEFLENVVVLIKYIQKNDRDLYESLQSLEGFAALFCDKSFCDYYDPIRCSDPNHIYECYDMFTYQHDLKRNSRNVSNSMISEWAFDVFDYVRKELDVTLYKFQMLPDRQKRKLLKIGRKSLSKILTIKEKRTTNKNGLCILPKNTIRKNKPPISTTWFGRDAFVENVVKKILNGGYPPLNEIIDKQQVSSDGTATTN